MGGDHDAQLSLGDGCVLNGAFCGVACLLLRVWRCPLLEIIGWTWSARSMMMPPRHVCVVGVFVHAKKEGCVLFSPAIKKIRKSCAEGWREKERHMDCGGASIFSVILCVVSG